jgi:hypothetical protein
MLLANLSGGVVIGGMVAFVALVSAVYIGVRLGLRKRA